MAEAKEQRPSVDELITEEEMNEVVAEWQTTGFREMTTLLGRYAPYEEWCIKNERQAHA